MRDNWGIEQDPEIKARTEAEFVARREKCFKRIVELREELALLEKRMKMDDFFYDEPTYLTTGKLD